ncbi:MAG: hypothetical protein MUO67_09425 [Anaerolineales bacterium]|nr:hypothetical protein [Anaerolineales bacterium]
MTILGVEIIILESNTAVTIFPLERCSSQVALEAPTKIHLVHRDIAVEEFLEMLRFDQRGILAEPPSERMRECSG